MATVYAQIRMTPALGECEPASLMTAVFHAAQAGLELDGVQAALVPYKKKAQFVPMYQGLLRAMMRSGVVAGVQVPRLVYKGDEFDYEYGLNERCKHVPHPAYENQTDDKIIAGYCIVTLTSGERIWEVTPRKVFDATANRTAGKNAWATDYAAMCQKTCVRRVAKYVAQRAEQAEFLRMVARDERFDVGQTAPPEDEFRPPSEPGRDLDDLLLPAEGETGGQEGDL
jgi:recombination protein RecT